MKTGKVVEVGVIKGPERVQVPDTRTTRTNQSEGTRIEIRKPEPVSVPVRRGDTTKKKEE
jgi:hypothetical protein